MNRLQQRATKQKTKKEASRALLGVISELGQLMLIAALVIIAAVTFGSRIPALSNMGFRFFSVISGSMEPTIPTGSMLFAGSFNVAELEEGDVITYQKASDENTQPSIITHRIYEINSFEQQREYTAEEIEGQEAEPVMVYEITTKGDANEDPDNYTVYPGEILGLYQWHVPQLGYLINFIQSPRGFISFVIIPGMILIIWESVSLILNVREWLEQRKTGSTKKAKRVHNEPEIHEE